MTQSFNVIVPEYPIHIELSKARKAKKFYVKDWDKPLLDVTLPEYIKKGLIDGIYAVRKGKNKFDKAYVIHTVTGKVVPANRLTVGKPRLQRINAQDMWRGGNNQWNKDVMKKTLEMFFKPFLIRQLPRTICAPKEHYIQLELIFFCPLSLWKQQGIHILDEDNHSFPYTKAIRDALTTGTNIIIADDPDYIRGGYSRYVNIDSEERRLEIRLHFCRNNQPITYGYNYELPKQCTDKSTGDAIHHPD